VTQGTHSTGQKKSDCKRGGTDEHGGGVQKNTAITRKQREGGSKPLNRQKQWPLHKQKKGKNHHSEAKPKASKKSRGAGRRRKTLKKTKKGPTKPNWV